MMRKFRCYVFEYPVVNGDGVGDVGDAGSYAASASDTCDLAAYLCRDVFSFSIYSMAEAIFTGLSEVVVAGYAGKFF